MRARPGSAIAFLILGLCLGLALVSRQKDDATPTPHSGPPETATTLARPDSRLTARELRIVRPDSSTAMVWGASGEGSPGLWMTGAANGGSIQMGLHGNGFPFVLVTDAAVRNFGLGRVDGRNASPILVYRSDDAVRLVFGLSMTEAGQPPFLAHYTADGAKHEYIGRYCDAPSRVCTQ